MHGIEEEEAYKTGYRDALEVVMMYTYDMLSEEKLDLQQFIAGLARKVEY